MKAMTYTQSNPSRYRIFKEKIVEVVKSQYSQTRGSGMIEPICFIGILADPLHWKSYFDEQQELQDIYVKLQKAAKQKGKPCPTPEEFVASHLAVMGLPLGIYFNDDPDMFKDDKVRYNFLAFKKDMAVKEIKSMIKKVNSKKESHVCYTAFVSEVFVASAAKHQAASQAEFEAIMQDIEEKGGLKNVEGAEDKVMIMFESEHKSDLLTFDILLNEDSEYCELLNPQENMGFKDDEILNSLKNSATGRFANLLGEKQGFSIN